MSAKKKNKKKKKRAKWWVREFGVVVFLVKKNINVLIIRMN
jgi:hypothetical protein